MVGLAEMAPSPHLVSFLPIPVRRMGHVASAEGLYIAVLYSNKQAMMPKALRPHSRQACTRTDTLLPGRLSVRPFVSCLLWTCV